MKVVVFGGTGPTGLLIVRQALAAGHEVTVVARSPDKVADVHERLRVVKGDAYDATSVAAAIVGADAVVSSLGAPYTREKVTIYSTGARNILAGMREAGVRRLVAITSGGTHVGRDPNNPLFFEWILKPFFGRTLYADMREMESLVMASDTDWTLFRPSRLMDTPPTGTPKVEADVYSLPRGSTVSRGDLASAIVRELADRQLVRRAAAVAE